MSIYDFDDELPEDELDQPKKPAQPKKKGKQVLNTQINLTAKIQPIEQAPDQRSPTNANANQLFAARLNLKTH
jgi:hypothetical protein